ncbi:DUF4097 family beta strand repeat-containing protein [Amycolatopsis sp. OK19-0408]|uniref:DUF4097 family beta strand repeat-containing protein n=1 Tax=Amycolatopsis iheyensis TaxID=2945988 RepID=A0A9X2SI16_9PSEU|nr:DUF4097 family beta strand repeat-containing protein [Amycolatopsis iheyensis]MCR6482979.1 DUF4097 family beta strand repeat-containing protein [Amycolatopsis iheyensis]
MTVFTTPAPITATLTTAGARIHVAASERADTVVRVEPIDAGSKSDVKVAEQTRVEFADGQLSVETTKSGAKNGSVAITIEVPAGSKLALNTAWTDVRAAGPLGDCALAVASGQVQLEQVAALRGRLAAGGVAVGRVTGAADIDGGAAAVRVGEAEGVFTYEGSSGALWIGHAHSDVSLTGAGGSFDVDRADGDVVAKAGHCPIRIGVLSRGEAELVNAAGGIEIGVSEGSTASVDADSTKGAVRNTLPQQTGGEQVRIHARTRLDDIVIHRAG